MTCAEAVVDRDGTLGPCGEQAAGWAVDHVSLYPACDEHATDTGRVMCLAVEMMQAVRAMDPVVGATVRAVTEAEIAHSHAVLDWARNRGITDDARIVQVAAMKQERTDDAGVTVHVTQIEKEP